MVDWPETLNRQKISEPANTSTLPPRDALIKHPPRQPEEQPSAQQKERLVKCRNPEIRREHREALRARDLGKLERHRLQHPGQQHRIQGGIGQIGMRLFHQRIAIRAMLPDEMHAERTDKIRGVAPSFTDAPRQLGGIHRLLCRKILEL